MATYVHDDGSEDVESPGAWSTSDLFYLVNGSQEISTNVDNNGADMHVIDVGPGFEGDFGTAASPIVAQVSDVIVDAFPYFSYAARSGSCHYSATVGGLCDRLIQDGDNMLHLVAGTATRYDLNRGTLEAQAAGFIGTLVQKSGASSLIAAATQLTTGTIIGGTCRTERGATTFTVRDSGHLMLECKTNAIGTLNVDGGTTTLRDCGTITQFNGTAGNLIDDLSRPLTITDCTIDISLPWAEAFLNNPLITFTNTVVKVGGAQ
jgi:hypothetical protein